MLKKKIKILIFICLIILIGALAPIKIKDKYKNFMAEPTWGLLEKSQVDDETIEEAIDRLITAHNDDANAHIGAGKSLDTHKTQVVIDHPADSVITDKVKDKEITNPKLQERVREFAAIVDAAGNYDYTTIQPAIDYVNGLGGGKILILNGTYTHSVDLILYSNISLIGETPTSVKLIFDTNEKGIKAIGDDTPYSAGTITFNNDSDQVVGVGTAWLANATAGQFIRLDYRWFEIESVEDDTHLTLLHEYRGPNFTGENYTIATFVTDIEVADITIEGDTIEPENGFIYAARCSFRNIHGTGTEKIILALEQTKDCKIVDSDNVYIFIDKSNQCFVNNNVLSLSFGVWLQYARDCFVINNTIIASGNHAIALYKCKWVVVSGNSCRTDTHNPIYISNSNECTITNNYGYDGLNLIRLDTSHRNRIIGNFGEGGSSHGIYILGSSTYNIIKGNHIKNYPYAGIQISSNCDYNTIMENIIETVGVGNTEPGIYLFETDYNTIMGNKCLDATEDGIRVYGSDYNIITGNICKDNDQWGIKVTGATSDKNIITNNQLLGNTSGALSDGGTATVKDNNVTA